MARKNELGQPIGDAVTHWGGAKWPERVTLSGRLCSIAPLDADAHSEALFLGFAQDRTQAIWTYMPFGPFDSADSFHALMEEYQTTKDPHYFAILDAEGTPVGIASLMRINPDAGTIEVGGIAYTPALQRTPAATEAMSLLMRYAIDDLGYRRYEWKCDSLNAPSRNAAERLGFTYEGLFRQALVYKNRNRDTAWFAIIDKDWPRIKAAHALWLAPENFDAQGQQIQSLADLLSSC